MHPFAWWAWALSVAVAASFLNNLWVLFLVAAATVAVAVWRRSPGNWARSMGFYLGLAGFIVALRLIFRMIFGASSSGTVLFSLPEVHLPAWAAGIRMGGPVVLDDLIWAATDAGRLAVIILAVGAAMTLADPRTALRSVPPALHDISVAIVITLTVLPQLIASARRINRGRRLRGHTTKGLRALASAVVPIMEDAVENSMTLATSMEARGYGRTRNLARPGRSTTLALFASIILLTLGAFVLLGIPAGPERILGLSPITWLAVGLLGAGVVLTAVSLSHSGKRLAVTRYRPAPWGGIEWQLLAVAVVIVLTTIALAASVPSSMVAPYLLVPALIGCCGLVGNP